VTPAPSAAPGGASAAPSPATSVLGPPALQQVFESLADLAEDSSVPRNIRRGAQSAREALQKPRVALDVRIASAVYVLDDLANDPNLPTHGRTAIWSIISNLESLQ
jgi:uncharacterized protein